MSVKPLEAVSTLHLEESTPSQEIISSVSNADLQETYIDFDACLKTHDWDTAYVLVQKLLKEYPSAGVTHMRDLEQAMSSVGTYPKAWLDLELALADYYINQQPQNREEAWNHWQKALDYWGQSTDLEQARREYIIIVRNAVSSVLNSAPADMPVNVPAVVLQNILKISNLGEDRAFAYFYLAEGKLSEPVGFSQNADIRRNFDLALDLGLGAEWYDRALYLYGRWLMQNGHSYYDDNGDFLVEPDYEQAVTLFRELTKRYAKSLYASQAKAHLDWILKPTVKVQVEHSYHPGTEMECSILMKNIDSVDVALYPVSLFSDGMVGDEGVYVDLPSNAKPLQTYHIDKPETQKHRSATRQLTLGQDLPVGAYYIVAKSGNVTASDILLISDATVVLKHVKDQVFLYFCDSKDGSPIPDAKATVWISTKVDDTGKDLWTGISVDTDDEGVALVNFDEEDECLRSLVWAAVSKDGRQAYVADRKSFKEELPKNPLLKATLFCDQPSASANRDSVRWAAVLRYPIKGNYVFPKDHDITYRVIDSTGHVYGESSVLPIDISPEAGLVNGVINGLSELNPVDLFVELEVKGLPDAQVQLPLLHVREDSSPACVDIHFDEGNDAALKIVHPGSLLSGDIKMVGAAGSLLSRELKMSIVRTKVDSLLQPVSGTEKTVQSLAVTLDSMGVAPLSYQLDSNEDGSFLYEIKVVSDTLEGKKTDAKRFLEVPDSYRVDITPQKHFSSPSEPVRVNVQARNALGNGQMIQGTLRLLRQQWREVWVDRSGKEISGQELQKLKESGGGWFSFGPSPSDYRLEEEGYVQDEVSKVRLTTDNQGNVEYYYEPLDPGYYVLRWVGRDSDGKPIRADSEFWVSDEGGADIGYRPEGIRLVVDDCDSEKRSNIPVLVTGPVRKKWILLVSGNDKIESWELIHPESDSDIHSIDLSSFTGNNAFVEACSVFNDTYYSDLEEILLYGASRDNQVDVRPNSYGYEPAQTAEFTVFVKDKSGAPVPDANVVFQIRERDGLEALRENIPCKSLIPAIPYSLSEKVSLIESPYFRPLIEDEKLNVHVQNKKIPLHFNESASFVGHSCLRKQKAPIYWDASGKTDSEGRILYEVPLSDQLGEWIATATIVDDSRCLCYRYSEFRTRLPMMIDLAFPESLMQGDVAVANAHIANNTFFNMALKLSLDSGEGLEKLSFTDGAGEKTVFEGAPSRDQMVSVPAKSAIDVSWELLTKDCNDRHQEMKLVAAMKNRITADTVSYFVRPQQPSAGQFISLYTENSPAKISFHLDKRQDNVSFQVMPNLEPVLYDCILDLLRRRNVILDGLYGGLNEDFLGLLGVLQNMDFLNSQYNLNREKILRELALTAEDVEKLKSSIYTLLRGAENPDGGWSWGQKSGSDVGLTAYTLWLLSGLEGVPEDLLAASRNYLTRELVEQNLDMQMQAWLLRSLAAYNRQHSARPTRVEARALISLIRRKAELSPMGIAFLALAAQDFSLSDEALDLLKSLEDMQRESGNGVFWESMEKNAFWGSNNVDSTALALSAFLSIDPGHPIIEKTIQWLMLQRKGFSSWGNSRSTCCVLRVLASFQTYSGNWSQQDRLSLKVNGHDWRQFVLNPASILDEGSPQSVPEELLQMGENEIEITSTSSRNLMCGVNVEGLSDQADTNSLSEISLTGECFRTHRIPTLLKGFVNSIDSFDGKSELLVGDRIEVILKIHVDSPVSYLKWSIPCPSGLSMGGFNSLDTLRLYRLKKQDGEKISSIDSLGEYQNSQRYDLESSRLLSMSQTEDGVEFLLDHLDAGEWEIHYSFIADSEGQYVLKPVTVTQLHSGLMISSGENRSIQVVAP
jgi:hypothetical protein